jgi:phosphopantothenoylcysteine decarboxylase/phosphopantothenate--cysteine ligase
MKRPLTFLVTAGPTVEDLDPVRFISNRASGRLGFEVARAARAAGHRVTLIHGPVSAALVRALESHCRLPIADCRLALARSRASSCFRAVQSAIENLRSKITRPGATVHRQLSSLAGRGGTLTRVPVRSAAQLHRAVLRALSPATDVVVMTAAVADFAPARVSARKLKKARHGVTLRLKPTVDILARLGRIKRARRPGLVLIGFALETGAGRTPAARARARLAEARRKLVSKNLDAIVLDTPEAMGAERGEFQILRAGEDRPERIVAAKRAFAVRLVKLAEECAAVRPSRRRTTLDGLNRP